MKVAGTVVYAIFALLGLYAVVQGLFGQDYPFIVCGTLFYLLGRDVRAVMRS